MIILPYAAVVAGVGLIESLLTLDPLDEITGTRGRGNKECVAQGAANILSGLFSSMGGCAMIGQSLINVSSGARAGSSGIVGAIMLLVFVIFAAPLIERLPMAALVGVMIMVAIGTFEWACLRSFGRMPRHDVIRNGSGSSDNDTVTQFSNCSVDRCDHFRDGIRLGKCKTYSCT